MLQKSNFINTRWVAMAGCVLGAVICAQPSKESEQMKTQRAKIAKLASALAAVMCLVAGASAQVINPGPRLSVLGGISPNGNLQPGLFTWKSQPEISGTHLAPNESLTISLHGPLNTLGVAPTDRVVGTLASDAGGTADGLVTIPYDGGGVGHQGTNSIPRPGRYEVRAQGAISGLVIAQNQINLCPATHLNDDVNIDWSRSRGGRMGILGGLSAERIDPEWLSLWDERPTALYGTVAETDLNGDDQPAFIAYHDYPFTHYAHDVNLALVPDPEYQWLISTANFYPDSEEPPAMTGRMDWEWETLNNGSPARTDAGNIGLPLWATPTAGDRIYTVGRWILDNGHPDTGDRSEIHPARLLATMRKRDTVVPFGSGGCTTRASQVDIYISGHGGGANEFPDGLSLALNNNGLGGGRIEDVLSSDDRSTYYDNGPVGPGEIAAYLGLAIVICGLSTIPEPVEPALLELCVFAAGFGPSEFHLDAGPSAFGWVRGPEERRVNDMDYDFDVPLPSPPAGATTVRFLVTHRAQDTVFAPSLRETITYGNPDPATGLPTTAHIHIPFSSVGNGIYARTLNFYWDKYNPPGRHFTVQMDDIVVNNNDDFGTGNDGEFFLWTDVCGQWIFLTGLNPDLMDAGTRSYPLNAPTFDVYLDPEDTLRVLTQGYEQDIMDSLFGQHPSAYGGALNILETVIDPINIPEWEDNDDIGGALFRSPILPISSVVGHHNVASKDIVDSTSYFNIDLTVNYVPAPPRIELNGVPAQFGDVCLGSSQDHVIQIFNVGEDPLDVTRITVSGAGFSRLPTPNVPFTVAGGEEVDITVRFSPTAIGQGAGTITIESTDPCQPSLTFALSGRVTYPALSAIAASTIFPATVVGCSRSQAVTVLNAGPCPLIVNSVMMAGAGYSVSPSLPFTLPPGASTVLNVTFAPTSVTRILSGTLTLASNDPIHPTTTVNFCGEGVPIGMRVLVVQGNGTPYAAVDQITLTSFGVKPSANVSLKNAALMAANSCQPISFHYEAALPATTTTGQRGSSYNLSVRVGKKSQSLSFTLGSCDFKQVVITLK